MAMASDRNETNLSAKPLTYRVENIPPGITEQGLIACFNPQDQPYVQVKSLCSSVDTTEGEDDDLTATILFQPPEGFTAALRIADSTITVDKEFYGFTPLYVPSEEKGPIAADVIAITGLAGHAYGSWAHSPDRMWLRDYLPKDVPNARILTYGYPSELQANNAVTILQDHTNTFVHRLVDMRESGQCESRPIVLIGHSLGCLIIKKALIGLETMGISRRRIPVRAVIFFAAPHRGLNVTALKTLVKGEPSERLIEELRAESATLTDLNRGFAYIAKDIEILTCYETKPTKTAINVEGVWKREGPPVMMVSRDSAQQFHFREKCVSANADHSQIAKLKKGQNGIYSNVKSAIRHALISTAKIMASVDASQEAKISKEEYLSDMKAPIDGNTPDAPPPYGTKTEPVQTPAIVLQETTQPAKALKDSSLSKQNSEDKNEAPNSAVLVSRPKEKTKGVEKPKENKIIPQRTSRGANNSDESKRSLPPPTSKTPSKNDGHRISKGTASGNYVCRICEDAIPQDATHYHCLNCPDSDCMDLDVCMSCFDRADLSSSGHDLVKARVDISTGDRFVDFS